MHTRPLLQVLATTLPLVLSASILFASAAIPAGREPPPAKPLVRLDDAGPGNPEAREAIVRMESAGALPAISGSDAAPRPNEAGGLVLESERREGDASVKVFRFGTTEVEGRTRWPAVTYFIRRLRAEFDPKGLPHRSFLPELESTRSDPAIR